MGIAEPPPFIHGTVDLLARAFAAEQIVLFGSYAKGAARPDSDVDLLVIANLVGDPSVHERRARNLVDRCFPRVDVVVCTPEDVAEAVVGAGQIVDLPFVWPDPDWPAQTMALYRRDAAVVIRQRKTGEFQAGETYDQQCRDVCSLV